LPSDKKLSAIDRAGAHGFLAIAERVTATAGQLVRTRTPHTLTFKGDRDIRSDVDLDVEKLVRNLLHEQTPDAEFLGEEEGGGDPNRGDDRLYWILDPIDGTVNFVHGVPLCAISLSLVRAGQVLAAVIELPFLNAQYSALLGHGIRMLGTSAIDLAWTAQGRFDACIMLGNKPWDTSAGILIAREAGARVLDLDGSSHSMRSSATVVFTPALENDLMSIIHSALTDVTPSD
jgi:myo-inositol-1(or 4)-monophosphatase